MPGADIEDMAVDKSKGGKIGPTAVGELEKIGDHLVDGAVGKVDADPVGAAKFTPLVRCTAVQGSRSSDQGSGSARSTKPKNLEG